MGTARAAAPTVEDRASLFSAHAVDEANQTLSRIYEHTTPHKQVYIETLPTLPSGKQADELAAARFRQQDVDGLFILMVKDPRKLAVTVGRSTESRFHDGEGLRSVMLERFHRGDYDGGLLAGTRLLESRLTDAFAATGKVREPVAPGGRSVERTPSHGSIWPWILLLGGGALMAMLIWRLRSHHAESGTYGPPWGDYGRLYGASAPGVTGPVSIPNAGNGGGWGKAIIGGAAGAVAGNWLYDRFARGDHQGPSHSASFDEDGPAPSADHGDVGDTFGGHGDGNDWSTSGDAGLGDNDW